MTSSSPAIQKNVQRVLGAIVTVLAFVFNEGIIIFFVHQIGPWWTTLLYTAVFGFLSIILFDWFEHAAQAQNWMGRSVRWFTAKAAAWRVKYQRLVQTSGLLAIFLAALFAGAFVSTILTGLLGYSGRRARVMIAFEALVPALFWSMFYAGLLRLFFH